MADEADKTKEVKKPDEGAKAKSGLIKYILMGVGGLVAVLIIAFGTLMIVGGGNQTSEVVGPEPVVSTESQAAVATAKPAEQAASGHDDELNEDSLLAFLEQDESVMEAIMANLEILDYVPDHSDIKGDETGMSVEDSIEAVNWLEAEKTKLAERQKELDAREKRLNVLDGQVSVKIARIEQAESARISKLAKLYDGMEARSVAQLVANLDDNTVVSLLPRMKLKNASSVLALMPPIRAARLSKQMITIAEN